MSKQRITCRATRAVSATDSTRKQRTKKETERCTRKVQKRIIQDNGFLLTAKGGLPIEDWGSV